MAGWPRWRTLPRGKDRMSAEGSAAMSMDDAGLPTAGPKPLDLGPLTARALPIVQSVELLPKRGVFVTGLYADAIVFTRLRSEDGVPAAAHDAGGMQALLDVAAITKPRVFRLAEIERLIVTPLRRGGAFRRLRFEIRGAGTSQGTGKPVVVY